MQLLTQSKIGHGLLVHLNENCDENCYTEHSGVGRKCLMVGHVATDSTRKAAAMGVWGHAPPENFCILGLLRAYQVHSR